MSCSKRSAFTTEKTVVFRSATFVTRIEGELRREIAALEEQAQFEGGSQRYTFGLALAPSSGSHLDDK